jgi:hypothetical protein
MRSSLLAAALAPSLILAAAAGRAAAQDQPRWDAHIGEPAAALVSAGWVGTPVSLENVRGNAVILAFWNADIPC